MSGELAGRSTVVIAGAHGIGEATTRAFAAAGAHVALLDVDAEAGSTLAQSLCASGATVCFREGDAANETDVESVIDDACSRFGGLDVVHANAGIGTSAFAVDLELDEWRRIVDVNLTGCFLAARTALRRMSATRGGSIIFTSSPHAFATVAATSPYAATKAGVLGLMRALAIEAGPMRIRVNAVIPGAVDTPMVQNYIAAQPNPAETRTLFEQQHPLGRLCRPDEVASAVLFLASDAASFITGAALPVDGGLLSSLATGVRPERDR